MELNEIDEGIIIVIRTLECDLCLRFDSIMLSRNEVIRRVQANSLNIGSHLISHNDHLRIVYFDQTGEYLGDTISLNISKKSEVVSNLSIQPLPKISLSKKNKLHRFMLKKFLNSPISLCIVGPSFAGKTSLSLYLESAVPERYSKRINHPPTMGKSFRRLSLGKTKVIIHDMGGQRDFWVKWEKSIINSDKVIFVIDGTANNLDDIKEALELTLKVRDPSTKVLILLNKMDLFIDGYTSSFLSIGDVLISLSNVSLSDVWVLETSVYNGICYNYGGLQHETSLAKVITDFLEF